MGDFRGAEEAHTQAMGYGFDPQPGLALTQLGRGDAGSAAAGIKQALAGAGDNRCRRVRLLAAQAEIALAMDDLATATAANEALMALETDFETMAVRSLAASVHGAVLLAHGEPAGALSELRRAQEGWQQVGAPYEVAGSRALVGRALHALGDDGAALLELDAARSGFERVGALPDVDLVSRLVAEVGAGGAHEHVARGLMFTDIVKSTDLIGLIGDDAWEDLLRWHDQMLGSKFAAHGGSVAHHTGDGFFVTFDDAATALSCAIGVQRALVEHRRDHGFAPQVRIGVHVAEATKRGMDYSGGEVHKAARIGALAEGGQILASVDAIDAADRTLRTADHRTVTLKGVAHPVEVASVDWQHIGA